MDKDLGAMLINSFLKDDLDEDSEKPLKKHFYKVIISDDDKEVHAVTRLVLRDLKFEGHGLIFFSAYTESETLELLKAHPDAAILFQDVVMDAHNTGLRIVNKLRVELGNAMIRIILRTGHPGEAPEDQIIMSYDINDYRLKTELTHQRLVTSVYEALRSFRDLNRLEKNRMGLQRIVTASSDMFKHKHIQDFYMQVLQNILSFSDDGESVVIQKKLATDGFIYLDDKQAGMVIAGTGRFAESVGGSVESSRELKLLLEISLQCGDDDEGYILLKEGFLIRQASPSEVITIIYIEGIPENYDLQLIRLFISHFAMALDHFYLNEKMNAIQKSIIYNLSGVIETRSKETANHISRVSEMADVFFKEKGLSYEDRELLKIASSMHDIGKIGISDAILLKPGKLTFEEFEVMKTHTTIGAHILKRTDVELFRIASDIAMYHHEKYNGTGYPLGLVGDAIPWEARVIALVDVFDALTHERCYKKPWSFDEASNYIIGESGNHFDPDIVRVFEKQLDDFVDILSKYPD